MMPTATQASTLQVIGLCVTLVLMIANVLLIPLLKSAVKGVAAEMFSSHNKDKEAHAGLLLLQHDAIIAAAATAKEASSLSLELSKSLIGLRDDVHQRFDAQRARLENLASQLERMATQMANLQESFVAHDAWERERADEPPKLRKRKS